MFRKASASTQPEEKLVVPKVFAFGVKSEEHRNELNALFDKLKIKSVYLPSLIFSFTYLN